MNPKAKAQDLFTPERSATPDGYRILSATARNLKCIREAKIDLDGTSKAITIGNLVRRNLYAA
jgi:hypothetical protein